jgi:hypothetical protein
MLATVGVFYGAVAGALVPGERWERVALPPRRRDEP